jgi:hypothetical protein
MSSIIEPPSPSQSSPRKLSMFLVGYGSKVVPAVDPFCTSAIRARPHSATTVFTVCVDSIWRDILPQEFRPCGERVCIPENLPIRS